MAFKLISSNSWIGLAKKFTDPDPIGLENLRFDQRRGQTGEIPRVPVWGRGGDGRVSPPRPRPRPRLDVSPPRCLAQSLLAASISLSLSHCL